jgi:regulator of nucleoside diphosphate kinase
MERTKKRLVLTKEDYKIIMHYINTGLAKLTFNRKDAEALESELKKAKLVNNDQLPQDIVRLNSTVIIKEEKENKMMELTVVTPDKADIRQRLISIMSPVGTALIGFRKGERVKWKVPAGNKTFTILDVQNQSKSLKVIV